MTLKMFFRVSLRIVYLNEPSTDVDAVAKMRESLGRNRRQRCPTWRCGLGERQQSSEKDDKPASK